MSFRFIHTADWQIGKPFGTVPGDAGGDLRAQRIRTVRTIAELASARQMDAVLVAGDVFDSNDVSDKTIVMTLEALKPFDGSWVLLPGNHDAALAHSVWTRLREMGLPANVVIADTPVPLDLWGNRAQVLPAPLTRRREVLDQTEWFDAVATPEGTCRIGLAHGSITGRLPGSTESSNDIAEARAERAGLSYLALGDWHGALKIAHRTYYAGTPETDRHKANESGFVHIVETGGLHTPERVEAVPTGRYSWIRREVELLDGTCNEALAALESIGPDPRLCVVSLCLSGSISLAERRRLARALTQWDARFHHLDVDDAALLDDPTPDDLDAIDTGGFVRLAVDRLKARADNPADPDRQAARMALRLMYLDHLGRS